jgi:hypothetical protein
MFRQQIEALQLGVYAFLGDRKIVKEDKFQRKNKQFTVL